MTKTHDFIWYLQELKPNTFKVRKVLRYVRILFCFAFAFENWRPFSSVSNFAVNSLISGGISSFRASAINCKWSMNSVINNAPSDAAMLARQKCFVSKPGIFVDTDIDTTVCMDISLIDSERSLIGVSKDSMSKPAMYFCRKLRNSAGRRFKFLAYSSSLV